MRRIAVIAAIAIGGSIAGHLFGSPTSASNWGSSNCGSNPYLSYCVADDRYFYVYLAGLNRSDIRTENAFILDDQLDNRTDMIASVVTGSTYDVRAWDNNYGDTGYWGATYCPSGAAQGGTDPLRWCKPQYIRYNVYYSYKYDSVQERRAIACHELGHTAGLRHHPNQGVSCMYDPVVIDALDGGHDIPLINQRY